MKSSSDKTIVENITIKIPLPPLQSGSNPEIKRSLQAIRESMEAAAVRWKEMTARLRKDMEPAAVQAKACNAAAKEAAAAMRKTAHMVNACSQRRAQNPLAELGKLVEELDKQLRRQKPITLQENGHCNQP